MTPSAQILWKNFRIVYSSILKAYVSNHFHKNIFSDKKNYLIEPKNY